MVRPKWYEQNGTNTNGADKIINQSILLPLTHTCIGLTLSRASTLTLLDFLCVFMTFDDLQKLSSIELISIQKVVTILSNAIFSNTICSYNFIVYHFVLSL